MQYKFLPRLLPAVLFTVVSLQAQKPAPLTNDNHDRIPFGKQLPPPLFFQRDGNLNSTVSASEPDIKSASFDSFLKRQNFSRKDERYKIPPPQLQGNSALSRQREKDIKFITHFELTEDLNKISDSYPGNARLNAYGSSFALSRGIGYFAAEDGIHGRELWRSDGTSAGTYLFKDLNVGEAPSNPMEITPVGNKLFFSAFSFPYGQELWVSDGTQAGTKMLADVVPGPQSSWPGAIVAAANTAFFLTAPNGYFPQLLWKTDGSSEGTTVVLDVSSTGPNTLIYQPTKVNNLLFFTVISFPYTMELWRSDGTPEGTFAVKNFGYDFWGLMHLTNYDNKLYLSANDGTGRKLWMSDGTAPGTVPAPGGHDVELTAYYDSRTAIPFQQIGNSIFIFGYSPTEGGGLFKYNSTNGRGLELAKSFPSSSSYYAPVQTDIITMQGVLFFKLNRRSDNVSYDELWRSDGTSGNTILLRQFPAGYSSYNLYPFNGKVYFNRADPLYGEEPWITDGTADGTKLLKDILPGADPSYPTSFTSINGKLLFTARDETGFELWTSNGTTVGTRMLKDINTHSTAGSYAGTYSPDDVAALGKNLIYLADDGAHGRELYKSDGTGATRLKELNVVPRRSNPIRSLLSKNDFVYFIATSYDSGFSREGIYQTNGKSKRMTRLVDMINYAIFTYQVADNGIIYFVAYNYRSGLTELWRSDGTTIGTTMLMTDLYRDINIVTIGNAVYFVAGNAEAGYELWKSDGTAAGTKMIKDIFVGSNGSYPFSLFPYKGEVYFGAWDGSSTYSFWKSNGTEQGTIKLRDIAPGRFYYYSNAGLFRVSNNILYFNAYDAYAVPYQGSQLWRTDGTPEGTRMVKSINPGYEAYPSNMTDVDGRLFFTANDGVHDFELWVSDGSEEGTRMVKDINPPGAALGMGAFTSAAGRLFFIKNINADASELWSSDGSEENTGPVNDEGLEKITSMYTLAAVNDKLFLSGTSYKYGAELYASSVKDKLNKWNSVEARAIPELQAREAFAVRLFPNPAKSASTLFIDGEALNVTVTITDITGKMVWNRIYNRTSRIDLPIQRLSGGIYTVTVSNHLQLKTLKLIKQ